jgi:hypothetical protein
MADKFIRIGSSENLFGYDNGDYSESIEVAEPIKCTGTPISSYHLATLENVFSSEAASAAYTIFIVNSVITHNGEVVVHLGEVVIG